MPKTKLNENLAVSLERHYEGSSLNAKTWTTLKALEKQHPEILRVPPEFKLAYRLMSGVSKKTAKALGCTGTHGLLKGGTYSPLKHGTSSWTVDLKLFTRRSSPDFLDDLGDEGQYMVLMEAPIKRSQFLGNPLKLAAALGCREYISEREVISCGPVALRRIAYVRIADYETRYERVLAKILTTNKAELPAVKQGSPPKLNSEWLLITDATGNNDFPCTVGTYLSDGKARFVFHKVASKLQEALSRSGYADKTVKNEHGLETKFRDHARYTVASKDRTNYLEVYPLVYTLEYDGVSKAKAVGELLVNLKKRKT